MRISMFFISLFFSSFSCAEIHQWVDENGKTHFGDKPPINANTTIIEVEINTYESPNTEALKALLNPKEQVVMYSAEWCGVCKKAEQYFKKNKIKFKEYDIEKSNKGKRDYKKLEAKGVPVILVGDKRLNGFSEEAFESLYEQKQPNNDFKLIGKND